MYKKPNNKTEKNDRRATQKCREKKLISRVLCKSLTLFEFLIDVILF